MQLTLLAEGRSDASANVSVRTDHESFDHFLIAFDTDDDDDDILRKHKPSNSEESNSLRRACAFNSRTQCERSKRSQSVRPYVTMVS